MFTTVQMHMTNFDRNDSCAVAFETCSVAWGRVGFSVSRMFAKPRLKVGLTGVGDSAGDIRGQRCQVLECLAE